MKDRSLTKPSEKLDKGDALSALLVGLNEADMLSLRRKIDVTLKVEIKDLKLTEELGLTYRQGQVLLDSVVDDGDVPASQRAQVFTSVNAMLEKIIKQQEIVFNAERLKRYEAAFMKVLEELPAEARTRYFDMYGEFLSDRGV